MRITLRFWLVSACLAITVIGAVLVLQSMQMPEWRDILKAEETKAWMPPEDMGGSEYYEYNARWRAAMNALRTQKWPLFDLGSGLLAFAATIGSAIFIMKINTWRDVTHLNTPSKAAYIFILCTIAWFWVPISEVYGIYQHFKRWEFPAWADSIIISFFYISVMAFIGWLVLAIFVWFVVLRRSVLPVSIWTWPNSKPIANTALSAIAAVSLAVTVLLILKTLLYGPFVEIPGLLLWAYATLIGRAAALSRSTHSELPEL